MKTMLLAAVLLGMAACGGTEAPLPNAAGDWSFATSTMSIKMTLAQSPAGEITGNATRTTGLESGTAGTITGNINGPENVHLRIEFNDASVAEILATGLPARMFGTVYVNSEGTVFEATRN